MSHVDFPLKVRFFCEVWKTCAVVNMEMSHQEELNLFWVYNVKVGQGLDSLAAWVHPTVEHDFPALTLKVDTAAAYLTSCSERSNL